jgi:ribA/ribD-fused uncharacterized protein
MSDIINEEHPRWNEDPDYHFFWGGYCSQWAISPFEEFGTTFNCAEQFMMAAKAKTFGDDDTYARIMAESDPREQKKLGREVKNFVKEEWDAVARDYVTLANYDKFTQNPEFLDFLMENQGKFFVEASPFDTIWGIGLASNADGIHNPANWKGTNWLGQCINRARDIIVQEWVVLENKGDDILDVVKSEVTLLRKELDWNK